MPTRSLPSGLATWDPQSGFQGQEYRLNPSWSLEFPDPAGFDMASVDGLACGGFDLLGGNLQPLAEVPDVAPVAPMEVDQEVPDVAPMEVDQEVPEASALAPMNVDQALTDLAAIAPINVEQDVMDMVDFMPMNDNQYPCADNWSPPPGGLGLGLGLGVPYARPPQLFLPAGGGVSATIDPDTTFERINHDALEPALDAPGFPAAQHGALMTIPLHQVAYNEQDQQVGTNIPTILPTLESYGPISESMGESMGQSSTDETPPSSPDMPSTPLEYFPGVPSYDAAQHGALMTTSLHQVAYYGQDQEVGTHATMTSTALANYGPIGEYMGTHETSPSGPDMLSTPSRILPGVYELADPAGPPPLLPRSERPATPQPRGYEGNKYRTLTQPWGCGDCTTAFMTEILLDTHTWFHLPSPPEHTYRSVALHVAPYTEERMRKASVENELHSTRMRCAEGKWVTFKQAMQKFGKNEMVVAEA